MRGPHRWFPILAAAVVMPASAYAKCAFVTYQITVDIRERRSAKPIEDVTLAFFLPGKARALAPVNVGSQPARTNSAGRFVGTVRFNPYSGWWFGDRCKGVLDTLEIVAAPLDRPAQRVRFRRLGSHRILKDVVALEPLLIQFDGTEGAGMAGSWLRK